MGKASIYTANTTETSVATSAIVPLGNIVRRPRNNNISLSGNAIVISDRYDNYYEIVVCATFTGTEAGTATLVLQENNANIVGGTASVTVTTADTEINSLCFKAVVRSTCGCNLDQLQILNTGIPLTISNITVSVNKI